MVKVIPQFCPSVTIVKGLQVETKTSSTYINCKWKDKGKKRMLLTTTLSLEKCQCLPTWCRTKIKDQVIRLDIESQNRQD